MFKYSSNHTEQTEAKETFFDPMETISLFNNDENIQKTERLKLIFNDEPFTLTSYFIVTLIMTFMAWPHTNQYVLSAWFISSTIILSLRLLLTIGFQASQDKNIRPQKWHQRLTVFSFVSGLAIGSCGFITMPAEQYFLPLILTVGLTTLSSISVSTLSIEKNLFPSFLVPALLPITLNTLSSGDRINFGIGLLILIFSFMLILLEKRSRDNMNKALQIRYENTSLLSGLTASKRQLEKKNSELEKLATRDHLTTLANRRYGDRILQNEWKKALRQKSPLAVLMIDIDQFKSYNDNYGHQMGDDALKTVAQAIKQSLSRPADLACRYGGEEFLVILPDTDIVGAFKIGRRIQEALYKVHIRHEHSPVKDYITISCGVADIIPKRNNTLSSLVKQADIAMYKAKFHGGDQVMTFK